MSAAKSRVSKAHDTKRETLGDVEETSAKKAARERTVTVIAKASGKTQEAVIKDLGNLKLELNGAIDSISGSLTTKIVELKEVQEAIAAEKANLETVHGIKAAADSLEALQRAHEEEAETFDAERDAEVARWEEEKKLHTKTAAEQKKELELARKREQEAYDYDTAKKRLAAEDAWKEEQTAARRSFADEIATKIAELNAREVAVKAQEDEIKALRDKVAAFDEQLKKEVAKAEAIVGNSVKRDLEHKHAIEKLGLDNQLSLKNSEIVQRNERIAELQLQNKELDAKYKSATDKVQDIAVKAIDGAARQQTVIQTGSQETADGKRRG